MEFFASGLAVAIVSATVVSLATLALAGERRSPARRKGLALFWSLVVLDMALVYLPTAFGAAGMVWAWTGKGLELTLVLGCLLAMPGWREVAAWPRGLSWLGVGAVVGLVATLPGQWPLSPDAQVPDWPYFAYPSTMPGLTEELMYRGILLHILDAHFGRPRRLLGVAWGWGVVLTTLLFFLAHALTFDPEGGFALEWVLLPDFALFSLAMCWLR